MSPRDPIIKLTVGAVPEILQVHKGLLCKSSEFFKRAMKSEWAGLRGEPDTIDLSGDCTETVLLYVQWLYTKEIQLQVSVPNGCSDAKRSAAAEKMYIPLSTAYVFGEKIMDISFKNAIVSKVVDTYSVVNWSPGPVPATVVYEGTTAGSPMRRLLSYLVAFYGTNHPSWISYFNGYPRELLVDALTAMSTVRCVMPGHGYHGLPADYLEREDGKVSFRCDTSDQPTKCLKVTR